MKKSFSLFVVLLFLLSGCSNDVPSNPYTGRDLKIGVIGEPPSILEVNKVTFYPMEFEELLNGKYKQYDAVFIMKECLQEASSGNYSDVFTRLEVPIIFVGTNSLTSFTTNDVEYRSKEFQAGSEYSVGIINGTEYGFGLYNDKENEETKHLFYSDLFRLIE